MRPRRQGLALLRGPSTSPLDAIRTVTAPSSYSVSFGRTARTMIYEDSQGVLVFTFDVRPAPDSDKTRWILSLDRRPMTADHRSVVVTTEHQQKRIDEAVERTAGHALSCGYLVE